MAFNRRRWAKYYGRYPSPGWTCPTCHTGTLKFDADSFTEHEAVTSRQQHQQEGWDPDMVRKHFTAWMCCSKPTCGEMVCVLGFSGFDPTYDPEDGLLWEPIYFPLVVHPMPDIIAIPRRCPNAVAQPLRASFQLLWLDRNAAANRLRVALEELLNHLGVQRRRRIGGKYIDMTLHQRIEKYQAGEPVLGGHLMAVKWLGNTASHSAAVSHDGLLDAFEILDHALVEIIEQRSRRVAKLAAKLAKTHRPKSRRRRQPPKPMPQA